MFKAAGGRELEGDAKSIAFIKLLPPDVRAHVTLHQDMPQYQDFDELKRLALKYIKVMLGINAERKMRAQPVRLVQEGQGDHEDEDDQGDLQDMIDSDGDAVDIPKFADMEVDARVEILAFMRAQGYKPADNRASSGRFVRAPGGRGRKVPSGPARREVPPRGRADITCELRQEGAQCNRVQAATT